MQPGFEVGQPFKLPNDRLVGLGGVRNYDPTPDGKQFVVMLNATDALTQAAPQPQIRVTLNWFEELKQRVR
jgi:hypothetical protein